MKASMKDVVKRYGKTLALDQFNLEVYQGEILGLLGPNGAGKTTAIRILAGLINADAGDTMFMGEKQDIKNIAVKRHMGLVTQEVTVFEDLTAEENLRYFGGLYGLKGEHLAKRVTETLDFVGLSDHAKNYPSKFSGGMSRRLNIACALVHEPEFLIMDEPTVGIDPQSRHHILEAVKRLAAGGVTILYTSHYMEEVQTVATRIAIMDQGHVILQGTMKEFIQQVQHEEKITMTVTASSETLKKELEAIQGVKQVIMTREEITIISGAGAGNLNRVLAVAQKHTGVVSISAEKPTLEDVFLTLTGKKLRDGGDA